MMQRWLLLFTFNWPFLIFAQGHYQLKDNDLGVSELSLRLSNSLLGRFDTGAKNALQALFQLGKNGNIQSEEILFRTDSFSSVVPLRDEHIKRELQADKFPHLIVKNFQTEIGKKKSFKGLLQVRQHSTPIQGHCDSQKDGTWLKMTCEFSSKISLVKVTPPTYFGVSVHDDYTVVVNLEAAQVKIQPSLSQEAPPLDL